MCKTEVEGAEEIRCKRQGNGIIAESVARRQKKVRLGWAGLDNGRLGPQRTRRGGAELRAYTQIEGEIRLIRTGNTAQNA